MVHVELEWNSLAEDQHVVNYEIERRPTGPNYAKSRWSRFWNFNLIGGWKRVASVPGNQNNFKDNITFNFRKRTYSNNAQILADQSYEYRIRAINSSGKKGQWTNILVDATGSTVVSGSSGARPHPVRITSGRMIV